MDQFNTREAYIKEKNARISDPFWSHDPSILWNPDRGIEFYPTSDMTEEEKLNALSRFFIYTGIIFFLVYYNYLLLFIPIVALAIIYMIHYNEAISHEVTMEQFDLKLKDELGIKKDTPLKITDVGDICLRPTPMNPFMNILINEYVDNPNRPPPCSQSDDDIKEETEKYFNYNLYRNVEDVWSKRNNQRQFVTLPGQTIPNDRDTFMKWLYKTHSCKDGDLDYCLQWSDLRVPGYS